MTLFSYSTGKVSGLVRGGQSRKKLPHLQPGNLVEGLWRARDVKQLGEWRIEPKREWGSRIVGSFDSLALLASMVDLLAICLPERQAYSSLFSATCSCLERLSGESVGESVGEFGGQHRAAYCRWEFDLIGALGFGVDLDRVLISGSDDDLAFVSPRSGRAVGGIYGAPWRDKLLPLPRFLHDDSADASDDDIRLALSLTGYFLTRNIFSQVGSHSTKRMPPSRRNIGA